MRTLLVPNHYYFTEMSPISDTPDHFSTALSDHSRNTWLLRHLAVAVSLVWLFGCASEFSAKQDALEDDETSTSIFLDEDSPTSSEDDTGQEGSDTDECPDDNEKLLPGICGCGIPDIDGDRDGSADCIDGCPSDPYKTEPGQCGCQQAETAGCGITEWVSITGGTFQMGSSASGKEQPIHQVTIPDFQLAKTEVTVAEYLSCVADGACEEPGSWSGECYWNSAEHDEYPVNCVSWDSATKYCQWAGGRLPSESEWEYAARSEGQETTYPWGNEAASCTQAVIKDGGDGCGTALPMPVCSKKAGLSAQGVCDMSGNVFEWVQDTWHANYDGAPTDGSAWLGSSHRFVRGGSFLNDANEVRSAFRSYYFGADYENTFIGFRCARSIP